MQTKEYQEIRAEAEDAGYDITDGLFDELLEYARRKAETAGKGESYIPYLLPDVIREYFIRGAINRITFAAMEFERYIKDKTQKQEVTEHGERDHGKTVAC